MALLFPAQPSFASGRLSPRMHARIDLQQYATGLAECQNFVILPQGGAVFRSGTQFVQQVQNSGGYVRLIPFVFSNTQAYIFELGDEYLKIFSDRAPLLDGGTQVELTTPYVQAELDFVSYDQSGDIMVMVNREYPPQEVRREGALDWEFEPFDHRDGPYLDENVTATTITPGALTGSTTFTASAIAGINNGQGFLSTDVGRHLRIKQADVWGWAIITAVGSTTAVTATIQDADLAGESPAATTNWRLGAWSDTDGWPEAVRFHQQRLFFARGQTVWGSVSGIFKNFSPTNGAGEVLDTNSVTYVLAASQINLVQWLASTRVLEVGTGGAELTLSGSGSFGLDTPLTPSAVLAKTQTKKGSFEIGQPIFSDRGTVYINRAGRKVFNYYYSFSGDSYKNDDLTLLSDDITKPFIFELAYQSEPNMVIWAVRGDGMLLGCTFNPDQEVVAWHEHPIGGSHNGGIAEVESVAVIPSSDGREDEVWVSVLRTINGQPVRYVEVMNRLYDVEMGLDEAFFVDSGKRVTGSPDTTIGGLQHLEGQEVAIFADGALHPNRTVLNGIVELDRPAANVVVGLPYRGILEGLPVEPGSVSDALTGRRSTVKNIGVKYYQTLLLEVGMKGQKLEKLIVRPGSLPLGENLLPSSGMKRLSIHADAEFDNRIRIEQNSPAPATVLGLYPIIEA